LRQDGSVSQVSFAQVDNESGIVRPVASLPTIGLSPSLFAPPASCGAGTDQVKSVSLFICRSISMLINLVRSPGKSSTY
jgi:hypothetical protein